MNKYEKLIEENQRFWESLDLKVSPVDANNFAALAEEDSLEEEAILESIEIEY